MSASRREFLAGLGAAVVAASCPATALVESARVLPDIVILNGAYVGSPFTLKYLFDTLRDIGEQIARMGPLTAAEQTRVAAMVDDCIWQIRPVGVRVLVETEMEKIARGEFSIVELNLGTVTIR